MSFMHLQDTLERIGDLSTMPKTHNSYGTPTVEAIASLTCANFLIANFNPSSPAPRVMPGTKGSLELEWNGVASQLKLAFYPNGDISGSFQEVSFPRIAVEKFFQIGILEIEKELGIVRPVELKITVQ